MSAARNVSSCLAMTCLLAVSALNRADGAESELEIRAASGRQFRGTLDSASNDQQLVLRTLSGQTTILRPIQWQSIASATIDGRQADVAALRAVQKKEQGTGDRRQGTGVRRINLQANTPADHDATPTATEISPPKVALVAFDASIANWDADVETDGLLIDVAPLDQDRRLIPIAGTLEVELFAPQRRKLELAPNSGGDTLELVERWTRSIEPGDFLAGGARLRLPFGAITPELQPRWTASPYGLVHIRLAIPGHGVFEDSRDMVRVRPYAPNRDRLEMKTGQRFLPTENLGRHD